MKKIYFYIGRGISTLTVASVTQAPWGGSTFKPLNPAWETNALHLLTARAALPQIRVETLSSQLWKKNNDILLQDNDILWKVFNIGLKLT